MGLLQHRPVHGKARSDELRGQATVHTCPAEKEIEACKIQPVAGAKGAVFRIFDAHRALCGLRACAECIVHAGKKRRIHEIIRVEDAERVIVLLQKRLKYLVQRIALAADLALRP